MVNKKRFDWAVGVLVKAYLNGTLERKKPHLCGVGNLVCAANGYKLVKHKTSYIWEKEGIPVIPMWDELHCVIGGEQLLRRGDANECYQGSKQIAATGYTPEETAKIEWAFETGGPDMFSGLMSVVDCLIEIHSGTESDRVEAKQLFETKI